MFRKTISAFAVVATLATAATFAMPSTEAEARGRGGAFVAGAITGLAVGTLAHHRHYRSYRYGPRYYYGGRYYYGPRYRPNRVRHYGGPRPWTRAWYRYCHNRYRSFNPRTGYFTTYSGRKRFCR